MNADVPLGYQTLLALVHELDRILDRYHVIRACAIDQIDQRAESRRLARSRWAGDEDQPLGQVTEALNFLGNSHLLDGDDRRGDGAKYGARSLAVAQRVAAEPGDADDFMSEVGVVDLLEFGAVLLEHDGAEHRVDLLGSEDGLVGQGCDLAAATQHRWRARPEVKIRRLVADERAQQCFDALERAIACCD